MRRYAQRAGAKVGSTPERVTSRLSLTRGRGGNATLVQAAPSFQGPSRKRHPSPLRPWEYASTRRGRKPPEAQRRCAPALSPRAKSLAPPIPPAPWEYASHAGTNAHAIPDRRSSRLRLQGQIHAEARPRSALGNDETRRSGPREARQPGADPDRRRLNTVGYLPVRQRGV